MYRISWTTTEGNSGHGDYCLSLEMANTWLVKLKTDYPITHNHWIESDDSNRDAVKTTCSDHDCMH